MIDFLTTLLTQAALGNFSFFILIVNALQLWLIVYYNRKRK